MFSMIMHLSVGFVCFCEAVMCARVWSVSVWECLPSKSCGAFDGALAVDWFVSMLVEFAAADPMRTQ